MQTHLQYMQRALELAAKGIYSVRQNPRVGCVIVNQNTIVGEGWHQYAGGPHAEILALQQAGELATDATCYITLEPCVHHGRTPPCVLALKEAGIKQVIIASLDPNPLVHGKGVRALRDAGITVEIGIRAEEAAALNKGFFKRMESQRPYIRVKIGSSLDGKTALANGKSQWISSVEARQDVQYWRARACAILTSSQTVLDDNPQLNVRDEKVIADIIAQTGFPIRQPRRLVLDTHLRTAPSAQIYQINGDVTIFTSSNTLISDEWRNSGINIVALPPQGNHLNFSAFMEWLNVEEINELAVEAGPKLTGALCEAGLVDEWIIYQAPKFLGPDARPLLMLPTLTDLSQAIELEIVEYSQIGCDLRIILR